LNTFETVHKQYNKQPNIAKFFSCYLAPPQPWCGTK